MKYFAECYFQKVIAKRLRTWPKNEWREYISELA